MGLRRDKRSRDRQGAVGPPQSPVLPPASGPPKGIKTPGFSTERPCRAGQPRSGGLLETGQSFDSWYCAPYAGGSFWRSAASSGRAGPGAGPAGRANGSTSFSFVPHMSCKLSFSFKES